MRTRLLRLARRSRERWVRRRRSAFLSLARHFTPLVAAEAEGAVYLVDPRDTSFGPKLFTRRGRKEMRVLRRALEVIEEVAPGGSGGTIVDVGAHVGTTTIAALQQGFEHAVAIEPARHNYRLLLANAALNDLEERVTALCVAASDGTGTATLALGTGSQTKPRILREGAEPRGEVRSVPITTLDALAEAGIFDPADVRLLWMDVEGHEAHVLGGAACLLDRSVPIVSELNPKLLDRAETLRTLLEPHYTHLLDMRRARQRALRPIADIDAVLDEYRPSGLTDVLVLRLPGD